MLTLDDIKAAAELVHSQINPTPQIAWPLLSRAIGTETWVKHENHTPIGAFKIRGGITFLEALRRDHPETGGVVTATRGNHGQSIARAATSVGMKAKILVPHGNSVEKNEAMRAFGAELIEIGADFDEARLEADRIAREEYFAFVPPFHRNLVRGVASYALEFLTAAPQLDTIYVPIGCGSGICGLIETRNALGLKTKIVGVVAENAPSLKLSFDSGKPVSTNRAETFADGVATRVPVQEAFEIFAAGAERIETVSEDAIAEAIRLYYRATHNLAEGAGAAALAALFQERRRMQGKSVGVILSGGNIDTGWFQTVIGGDTPTLQ
ncbi:MAG: threonine dehydratase [Rhodobacteraceae bacterium]|nr:threonine dehydratase [Paracoccaceae bacterium]